MCQTGYTSDTFFLFHKTAINIMKFKINLIIRILVFKEMWPYRIQLRKKEKLWTYAGVMW
jgi:hypothetical protein